VAAGRIGWRGDERTHAAATDAGALLFRWIAVEAAVLG
jgi:hypothetical protein